MSGHRAWRGGVLATVVLSTLVAGCGGSSNGSKASTSGSPTPSSKSVSVWYVNPLPSTPDWGRSATLFKDAAASGGYKANVVGPDKLDVPAMVADIEQAIASKADGIITCSTDPAAFKGAIDKAKQANIVVVSVGCVDPEATFSVGTGNEEYGMQAADTIAEQMSGKANVGIISTDQTTPNQVAQVKGFRKQIAAKYPDIKELTWQSDNSDAGVAAQKMSAMITAYPSLDYIWIIEGAAAGAAPAALKEAGKKPGDIKVLAIDAQDSTLKAIKDGWITTTLNQCWFNASPNIGKLIVDIKTKKATPKTFYPVGVDPVSKDNLPYKGCPQATVDAAFAGS